MTTTNVAPKEVMVKISVYDTDTQQETFTYMMSERNVKYSDTWKHMLEIPGADPTCKEVLAYAGHIKKIEHLELYDKFCKIMSDPLFPFQERFDAEKSEAKTIENLTQMEKDFITGLDQDTLFEMTTLANYLANLPMLETMTFAIAEHIKNKEPEEIRKIFSIPNDYTDEERKQIEKDCEFIEEVQTKT